MKPVRRSQLISPWGIGAMVDFPGDESLMACGLDAWPFATERCPEEFLVREERLEQRLGVDHLRLPPDFRLPGTGVRNPNLRIPFVRFPRWHYCPWCGNLEELALYGSTQRCTAPNFAEGRTCKGPRTSRMLPERFIAVCPESGHIQDFPFTAWVHRDRKPGIDCRLRRRAGRAAASLAGINLSCLCGARRTMAGAFSPDPFKTIGVTCSGQRPWLGDGPKSQEPCTGQLQVLQRGASNVYFSNVASSIYLPLWAERASRRIVEILEDPAVWSLLSSGLVNGKIDPARCASLVEFNAKCQGLDVKELMKAAQERIEGTKPPPSDAVQSDAEYRRAEYEAIRTARGAEHSDLFVEIVPSEKYDPPVRTLLKAVGMVHKLRETRAFCGFARYLPEDKRGQPERIASLKLDPRIRWLPAAVVRGEGIFLEFDLESMGKWINRKAEGPMIEARAKRLADNYNRARARREQSARMVSPEFIMIHTVSHLIINQLSFECGYGSSSIRERIYCDSLSKEKQMAGVLLYTASGDSEGTMGGLVRQGQHRVLERTLARSLRKARWCSSDPVCAESVGQGPDSCNLAACHGCALLPETSCEEGNRLLDRALVIGLPESPTLGYFGMLLQ